MSEKIKYKTLSGKEEDKAVLSLAYEYLVIKTCQKCGYPRVDGYCCSTCGDSNPEESYEEEEAYEIKSKT